MNNDNSVVNKKSKSQDCVQLMDRINDIINTTYNLSEERWKIIALLENMDVITKYKAKGKVSSIYPKLNMK